MFAVHNAFRRDLARMQPAAALAGERATREALSAGWATFSQYLTVHHIAEDEALWPVMHAKLTDRAEETSLLMEMADEHALLDPILREIDHELAHGLNPPGESGDSSSCEGWSHVRRFDA
jgi:iron-sulfur cluster repair protein YtfE (RIC family)